MPFFSLAFVAKGVRVNSALSTFYKKNFLLLTIWKKDVSLISIIFLLELEAIFTVRPDLNLLVLWNKDS